jgi:shikimate kinase
MVINWLVAELQPILEAAIGDFARQKGRLHLSRAHLLFTDCNSICRSIAAVEDNWIEYSFSPAMSEKAFRRHGGPTYTSIEPNLMHIYLLGYRGCGKSTVASLLAQLLDRPSIDTDDWIESATSQTIRDIFASVGEPGFRDLEQRAIAQVAGLQEPSVVALGGGAVLRAANRQVIIDTGHRVWLKATPERLYERIQRDSATCDRRPSLTDQSGFEEVVKLLAERNPIYESLAEFTVDTDERTPDQVVDRIATWIESMKSAQP